MTPKRRLLSRTFAAAALALVALVPLTRGAQAQGVGDPPDWWDDSAQLTNPYVYLFMYAAGEDVGRFQLWTTNGNLEDDRDDLDTRGFWLNTDGNLDWPWGPMVLNGLRPTQRAGTTGEDRMYANHLTLHVQDSASANGFTDYQFPDDGAQVYFPPVIPLPPIEGTPSGFWTPFTFPAGGATASGIDLEVNQIVQFARDMVRVEVAVRNLGSSRRVGARMIIAPYTDNAGGRRRNPDFPLPSNSIADSSVFIPDTRQRIRYETELRGAQIPEQYLVLDFRDDPIFVAKGLLRGNDATTPSKVIFGNMLDIFPWAIANTQYDWTARPGQRLDISDIGTLMYFEPELISTNQTKSFVTYAGLGVVDHGMSLFYQSKPDGTLEGAGYVGGLQTDFGLPVGNGDVHLISDTVSADIYNPTNKPIDSAVAFLNLPMGLELVDPEQSLAQDIGFVAGLESGDGTGDRAQWEVRPNGVVAGLLEVSVDYSNEFGDSARATRKINVPQGRRYQFDNQYRMLTFPFTFTGGQNTITTAFNLPRTSFQAFRYNPLINQYETVNEVVPGEAYWVRMNGLPAQFVDVQGGTPLQVGSTRNVMTTIRRGWNQVGNPSPYAVRVADIEILTSTGFLSYADAVRRGEIRPTLYEYDFVRRVYVQLTADSILQPGRGVWIYANTERRIRWPQPEGPGVRFN